MFAAVYLKMSATIRIEGEGGVEVEPGVPLVESPLDASLDMATQGVRHRLFFSRTAGEQATFLITAEGITSHGKDAESHSLEMLELI